MSIGTKQTMLLVRTGFASHPGPSTSASCNARVQRPTRKPKKKRNNAASTSLEKIVASSSQQQACGNKRITWIEVNDGIMRAVPVYTSLIEL